MKLFCALVGFLAIQGAFSANVKSVQDIIDQAKQQLEQLKSIVKGEILTAHTELEDTDRDFIVFGNNILMRGGTLIHEETDTITQQVTALKDLAFAANKDISSCTDVRQELLDRMPGEHYDNMRNCIYDNNHEEARMVTDAKYNIDVSINKVHRIEHELNMCGDELTCVSPILSEIELDKIRLPQQINTELLSITNLLTTMKLSVQACSDDNVSSYITEAGLVVADMTECANKIIG